MPLLLIKPGRSLIHLSGRGVGVNGTFVPHSRPLCKAQRRSCFRPCCRYVRAAASVSWATSHRLLRSASMTALRHITAETFCAMPLSLTINRILQYFVTKLFAANLLKSARTAPTHADRYTGVLAGHGRALQPQHRRCMTPFR
jgi:hypothetical protein